MMTYKAWYRWSDCINKKVRMVLCACLFVPGLSFSLAKESFYKRPAVFSYRPGETTSKHILKRFGPVGMAIELHQPAFVMKVGELEAGSPAEAAGLRRGDLVTRVEGDPVASVRQLQSRISSIEPGESVLLEIWRFDSSVGAGALDRINVPLGQIDLEY